MLGLVGSVSVQLKCMRYRKGEGKGIETKAVRNA